MTAMRDLAHAQALVREALAFRPTPADAVALADGLAADRVGLGPLWQLLVGANLLPFAGVLLDWHGAGERLEASQAAFLRASTEQNAVRQAVLLRRAAEATRRLASQGIEATWLKGAWISARIVERPAMRYMEDIDLLVATAQFDAARSALVAMGFERELAADAVDPRIPSIALRRPDTIPGADGQLRIDLHRGVAASADEVWDADAFWTSTMPTRIGATTVRVPSPSAGLLIAAVHAFKHGYDTRHRWSAVADASAIVRAAGSSLDLSWLDDRIDDPRAAIALYLLLGMCADPADACARDAVATIRARATTRVETAGLRAAADRVLHHGQRLRPITGRDFSLMAIGEQLSPLAAARRFLSSAARRRRRHAAAAPLASARGGGGGAAGTAFGRLNWRYAYTTFLVGRLASRCAMTPTRRRDP
jgi:hypothetical protein